MRGGGGNGGGANVVMPFDGMGIGPDEDKNCPDVMW